MIALLAGTEDLRSGPIPMALVQAGFEARETSTTDQADDELAAHGAEGCVLVVEAASLGSRAGGASWTRFLCTHPALAAVVVGRGGFGSEARALAGPPHRILLEDPFDASAVVAAARRASAIRRPPLRRVPERRKQAG